MGGSGGRSPPAKGVHIDGRKASRLKTKHSKNRELCGIRLAGVWYAASRNHAPQVPKQGAAPANLQMSGQTDSAQFSVFAVCRGV